MDMHQSPRAIGGTLKDLRLTALRVVWSTIQFCGVERPVELRPSAVTVDRDLQAALLQLTLGEISAKKTHHQLVTNGMIGGVITGGSDKRHLIPMRPDAVHDRRVTPIDRRDILVNHLLNRHPISLLVGSLRLLRAAERQSRTNSQKKNRKNKLSHTV